MENYSNPVSNNQNGIPPKTWLVESILVTIFCCQILGIISIIYAAGVETKFYRGDISGAESASRTAKTLVIISASLGLFLIALFIILGGIGLVAGWMNH
jgi:hypothetical protein